MSPGEKDGEGSEELGVHGWGMDELTRRRMCRLTPGVSVGDTHQLIVNTDHRGRLALPGYPNRRFAVQERADGSVLLVPSHLRQGEVRMPYPA